MSGDGGDRKVQREGDGLDALARLAEQALAGIPPALAAHCQGLVIRVSELPERDVLAELEIDSPLDLLGLYQGVGLPYQSVSDPTGEPDMIWLYRQPILSYQRETGETLDDIVRHVLIHEIGHHFGFSDDDMELIENGE
ncbi:metallopeptidase family protein [Minwuia sp.]|uniref:metallopeptidase family protein n=1 Tax=Minwuia sp. TaxID=2493630 RepID=UPI003A8D8542